MRFGAPFVVLCLAPTVWADREVTIPKGRKIRDGFVRFEYLALPGERDAKAWLGTGFMKALEIELASERSRGEDWRTSMDLSYNYAPPILDISPGVSVGVQDVLNRSSEGRAAYLAVTYRYGNDGQFNQDVPTELTLGLWTRKTGAGFMGVSLPFTDKVFLIGEHNSKRLAAGFELRPVPGINLKAVFETGGTHLGFSLSRRF